MKTTIFEPKKNIEEFLNTDLNFEIYKELKENPQWKGKFEPLEFLNLLHEQFSIVWFNKEKPITVMSKLKKLKLDRFGFWFFLHYLILLYQNMVFHNFQGFNSLKAINMQLEICMKFIKMEYEKLDKELFPSNDDNSESEENLDFDELNKYNDMNDIDIFFNRIRQGQITQIETLNTIERLTGNLSPEKIKILLDDFEFYLFEEKEDKEAEFTHKDIEKAIKEYAVKNKDIPYKYLHKFKKDESGQKKVIPQGTKIIDIEALLFPYEFFYCYRFIKTLKGLIKKQSGVESSPQQTVIPPPEAGIETAIRKKESKTTLHLMEFPEYFLHEERVKLAEMIRREFKTEKGKSIRLLLLALEKNEPQLINTQNRKLKAIHGAMARYFERNIGSYQSVADYKYSDVDKVDFDAVNQKLRLILKTLSINK